MLHVGSQTTKVAVRTAIVTLLSLCIHVLFLYSSETGVEVPVMKTSVGKKHASIETPKHELTETPMEKPVSVGKQVEQQESVESQLIKTSVETHESTDEALLILSDHKYVLWAVSLLKSLRAIENESHGNMTTYCILVANITETNRNELSGFCTFIVNAQDEQKYLPRPLLQDKSTTTHWYKLLMLTHPMFRSVKLLRYMDVDHVVHSAPNWMAWAPRDNNSPVAMMAGDCLSSTGRFREFKMMNDKLKGLLPKLEFDASGRCLSTRIMALRMDRLLPYPSMMEQIDKFLEEFPPKYYAYWEQGFLQLLFWNNTYYLDDFEEIEHLYHIKCRLGPTQQCLPNR
mmetsp:Transcript_14023/g.30461  ORF Transcript_14023/g.30461 Transcript_14023/m.30461 type:complete len:343 (-) Transcript_14023:276-1304(-)